MLDRFRAGRVNPFPGLRLSCDALGKVLPVCVENVTWPPAGSQSCMHSDREQSCQSESFWSAAVTCFRDLRMKL